MLVPYRIPSKYCYQAPLTPRFCICSCSLSRDYRPPPAPTPTHSQTGMEQTSDTYGINKA